MPVQQPHFQSGIVQINSINEMRKELWKQDVKYV